MPMGNLATAASDAQAPAFSNLFVQTEILAKRHAILCNRRPRGESDPTPWMFHLMAMHGATAEATSYETDRMRFVGRGNSAFAPQAMLDPAPLSGFIGGSRRFASSNLRVSVLICISGAYRTGEVAMARLVVV